MVEIIVNTYRTYGNWNVFCLYLFIQLKGETL